MTAPKSDTFWEEIDRVVENFDKLASAYAEGPSLKQQLDHYRFEYERLAAQMRTLLTAAGVGAAEKSAPVPVPDRTQTIVDAARWVDGDLWNDKYPNLNRDSLNALHQAFKKADADQKS